MTRINAIDHETAEGPSKELLDAVKAKLGFAPNMMKTMAQSPSVLEAYLNFSGILGTTLDAKLRERIALVVKASDGANIGGERVVVLLELRIDAGIREQPVVIGHGEEAPVVGSSRGFLLVALIQDLPVCESHPAMIGTGCPLLPLQAGARRLFHGFPPAGLPLSPLWGSVLSLPPL